MLCSVEWEKIPDGVFCPSSRTAGLPCKSALNHSEDCWTLSKIFSVFRGFVEKVVKKLMDSSTFLQHWRIHILYLLTLSLHLCVRFYMLSYSGLSLYSLSAGTISLLHFGSGHWCRCLMFLGNFGEYSDIIPGSGEMLGPPLFGGLRSVAAVFSHPDRIQVGL